MRNTKIALAVLALVASTAAMADGATVYGTIDTSVGKQTNQTQNMNHSTWGTSVFGIKGSEDLDNGMKASFQLEAGIDSATGSPYANGGPLGLFNRAANVSLSGEFGSIKVGNQLSPYIAAALGGTVTDNASYYVPMLLLSTSVAPTKYNTAYSTTGAAAAVGTGGFFIPNAISYTSPSIGGFSASALKQLPGVKGSSTPETSPRFEDYTAYSTSFNAGDVSVSAGYESNGFLGNALSGAFTNSGVTAFGARTSAYTAGSTYTMGALKLGAGYMKMDYGFGNAGTTVYHVGAAYSANEHLVLNLNYAAANNGNGALLTPTAASSAITTSDRSTIVNLGAKYSLSKRTYTYGTISRATNGALSVYNTFNTTTNGDTTGYAVGVGHNF